MNVKPKSTYTSQYLTKTVTLTNPQKFSFDYKWIISDNSSVEFYINWVRYLYANSWTPWISTYQTYTTPMLPVWEYNFTWRVYNGRANTIRLYLDNMQFTCIWWWEWCWWADLNFENGALLPWNLFTFEWDTWNIPWIQTTDKTEWEYAIVNVKPKSTYTSQYLTKTVTLTNPQKFSFDYKWIISDNSSVEFYINWVRYLYANSWTPWISTYQTFTTSILPIWTYEFKWKVYNGRANTVILYLDNMNFIN